MAPTRFLADVVQVPGHGPQDDAAGGLRARARQDRAQDLEDSFGGPRRDEQLGHEVLALFEEAAHLGHGRADALADDGDGIGALVEQAPGGRGRVGRVSLEDCSRRLEKSCICVS